jgi:hypothetical protein
MVVKAAIGFLTTDSDAQLIVDTHSAITGLTGNASFPTPTPTVASITTALSAFQVALADAANGGKELTAIKNAKRAELVSLMRQLASYVTITAAGDMATLLSSGFAYQKPTRSKVGDLPAPGAPVLKQTDKSGTLYASTSPVYGAASYNWSVALASAPDKSTQTAQTIGGRYTFDGLTPGVDYSVTVNAVGAAGLSDWSDAATLIVI